ncbi:MAG: hypothetical protein LBK91_07585 [Synergistaceae bacterium]|nr:hypothetical protein [Synergistaceae bacterium]
METKFYSTIEELRGYMNDLLDGDRRAVCGNAPDIDIRNAERLGAALAAWEQRQ